MIDDELEQPQSGAEGYQSPDVAAGAEETGGMEDMSETPEMGAGEDAANILNALRNARPAWIDQPQPGAEGYQSPSAPLSVASTTPSGWNKTDYQAPFPESVDTTTATQPVTTTPPNVYTFEMFDATDSEGNKVLILDGVVFGPFDDGTTPEGMGGDDFIININPDEDAYLVIPIDPETREVIPPITIATGETTPDDTEGTLYVTIGNFSVDSETSVVTVENTLCGDYTIPNTLDVLDEDGNVFSDIQSIQFSTAGSNAIDVAVSEDAPGQVTVTISVTPELQNLLDQVQNLFDNLVDCNDQNTEA